MNTTNIMKCFLVPLVLTVGIVIIWYTDLHIKLKDVPHAISHKYSLQKCLKKSGRFLSFPEYHECLYILAESRYCQDGLPVPKLVHYIFLGNRDFTFFYLLSILSSYRILKPGFIFVHTEKIPNGKWWDHLLELVPNLVIIKTTRVTRIFDKPVKVVQHQADIMRIQLLMEFGGIYMDTDELALKSFDPLRVYPITLGPCRLDALGVQAIIASKNSTFLKIWYWTYETFEDKSWAKNSQYTPYKLSRIIPELIHVERLFAFAGFSGNVHDFFNKVADWSQRYGLHLYIRLQEIQKSDPEHIKKLNSTYGQIARLIYYGKTEMIQ